MKLHLDQIEKDRALQWYGAMLALTIPVTLLFWHPTLFTDWLASFTRPFCWPGLEPLCRAHPLRHLGLYGRLFFWLLALSLAFASCFYFIRGKVSTATRALIAAFSLKALWQSIDYTLMGNYHYMPYAAFLFFLFLRDKRRGLILLIFLFYWFAGLLKLNGEWIEGHALRTRPNWMPALLFQASLVYAVFLELVMSFGLLAKDWRIRSAALAQFALFHAFSWIYVGFFYPLTMGLLLTIYVFDMWYPRQEDGQRARFDAALVAFFCVLQLLPRLSGRDPALFTHWRLPALNMYDANSQCESGIYIRSGRETVELAPDYLNRGLRVRCDPIMLLSDARSLCAELRHKPEFDRLDLFLLSRRMTDDHFTQVLERRDFCGGVK